MVSMYDKLAGGKTIGANTWARLLLAPLEEVCEHCGYEKSSCLCDVWGND